MTWSTTLKITDEESLDVRLRLIIQYIFDEFHPDDCRIADIDATGKTGNDLTNRINAGEIVVSGAGEILSLLNEDGQILELDLYIQSSSSFQIKVRDGLIIELYGDVPLPDILTETS